MTLKVAFRKAARAEFDAAALWYKQRHPSLGLRFVAEIDRAVELAATNPNRFPVKHEQIRCVQARHFPYSVFYLVESERIVVLAVFHARRDPAIWQKRK